MATRAIAPHHDLMLARASDGLRQRSAHIRTIVEHWRARHADLAGASNVDVLGHLANELAGTSAEVDAA